MQLLNWIICLSLFVVLTGCQTTNPNLNPRDNVFVISGFIDINGRNHRHITEALERAERGSKVIIEIRSNGGYPQGALRLAHAMNTSKAHVHVIVRSYARSTGGLLACQGNSRSVASNASVMYHLPGHRGGRGPDVILKDPRHPSYRAAEALFKKCKRFLTRAQLGAYYAGQDVFINARQIR